jgi:protein-tyrosine kinase
VTEENKVEQKPRRRPSSVEKAARLLGLGHGAPGSNTAALGAKPGLVQEKPITPRVPPVVPPSVLVPPPGLQAHVIEPAGLASGTMIPPNGGPDAGAPIIVPRTSRRVILDFDRMRTSGIVTPQAEHGMTAEEFRLVKRPLLLKAMETGPEAIRNGNLIMVASARPGEGKTFCAVSLAMSIAQERDLTVLLIDADVIKPEVPAAMGFDAELGLVDLISDENLDVPDVMLRTQLDNLSIIPAGRPHDLATELLASERMEAFVEDVAKRYPDRIIIFDSPPTLLSSIGGVLALHVGQILFVVEAERTTQAALDNALGLVAACKNISLLLNKARPFGNREKMGSYYGGSYYYR